MEKCRYKSLEELPAIMCADDVKDVLGISISSTYELMKEKDFPSFKIGRRVVIYKEKFIEWIEKRSEKKWGDADERKWKIKIRLQKYATATVH